ncbi:response regulator [Haloplanus sp. GCM10025708]|uniref:response regulator n=1 Tax=Haloferacaceae TaxID=1644056 RepID=UPI003607BFF9
MTDSESEPTVLVVEDEQPLADLYSFWLEEAATVRTAYDGEEALDRVDEDVDVVLLDRRMPGLSGDEVLDRFDERGLDCRVVMVTAVDPDFDIVDMNIDDYLVKPITADDLEAAVDRMVRRDQFDEELLETYRLVEKKAALESAKSQQELRASEEYARLERRVTELRNRVDETVSEFTQTDFVAAFRDLSSDDSPPDGDRPI